MAVPEWMLPLKPIESSYDTSIAIDYDRAERRLYYVSGGGALVSALNGDSEDIFTIVQNPGEFVGLERLEGLWVSYRLRALPAIMHLQEIELTDMSRWLKDGLDQPAQRMVLAMLKTMTSHMRERLAAKEKALPRVADFLLDHAQDERMMSLPRGVMAKILSMRPETLSRILRILAQDGMIELRPKLKVINEDALREFSAET